MLSGPPHLPNETNSNYDQKDLSNSPDLETSQCRSVNTPSNAEWVSSTQINGLEITSDRTQNPCEGRTRPERRIYKNLLVIHTNVNGWTTCNVGHEL